MNDEGLNIEVLLYDNEIPEKKYLFVKIKAKVGTCIR